LTPEANLEHLAVRRIVLVTGGLDCGGAQRVMADMANYWSEKGWQVTLATWSGPELADFYALSPEISRTWLHVDAGRGSVIGDIRAFAARLAKLRALLRKAQPDVVLSFIDVSNVLTILAAWGLGVRVVVSERTHPGLNHTVSRPWKMLRRVCYGWADQVVAQTQDAAQWIERHCKTAVLVIPNSLRALPQAVSQRESLIIAVGRLSKEKGFDVLLEAFARIRAQFPDWRVCIIGEGPETGSGGPSRPRWPGSRRRILDGACCAHGAPVAARGISERRAGRDGHGRCGHLRRLLLRPRGTDHGRRQWTAGAGG